ncbi:hypothetical protein ACD575_05620 [Campylobacter sp. LH-2024]|uniref:Uncharacterized protein n=1 Tax=Campylobacter molothri TaxID=1032242 RepID=A0ACC5W099_9BACT|nr:MULTISPECIES: hypothetical protein [unclassified Campylobacter]MBZ7929733.1 hypothetical protein [Campylobacter sp. W0067]MBZ7931118.1 hypothetical protein [Campylobacter sp. RM12910]MBZ7932771.1 hypothetical protein [Campylobacter sp. RM10543]MBZ7934299.1 hypothetical protein [Campylobacter sp. W0065]MBZ7936906.1 hypothetical protein [Campylobacter sp. RM10538]MBZ7939932.1 hypothetical protein [Campylobacter sp. W0047]MBZ7943848.1 hypothetical protein [Campylobacter sp. RM13744]MBZ79451
MKYLNVKFIFVGILTILLGACKGDIPKCGDKDVQNVLSDILLEHTFSSFSEVDRKKLKFTYGGFMSDLTDKESKTQYCKAQVKVSGVVNSRPYKWDNWINYSARYTDDGMVYVEITR